MTSKFRLTILSFFQFFVWGAWLITIATYFFSNNMGTGVQFGAIFSTLAISSLISGSMQKGFMAYFIFYMGQHYFMCHR